MRPARISIGSEGFFNHKRLHSSAKGWIARSNLPALRSKLEEVYSPAEVKVIFIDFFGEGEVTGCNGIDPYRDPVDDAFRVQRNPGESVDAFMDRAADIAKAYYEPVGRNCLVLRLERDR